MRRLYISAALVLLLAVLSGLHVWHLNDFTEELAGRLSKAQEMAGQEDWEGAARLTREVKDLWMKHEGYLHVTLRHEDIDEYAASNARLLTQLGLLVEAELPTLTNIL